MVDTWDTASCVWAFPDMLTNLIVEAVFNVETHEEAVEKFPCAKLMYD
jgi:hypothetical protein